jgi:uncharacterized surface protein with fasciclin (FAS1) repeats
MTLFILLIAALLLSCTTAVKILEAALKKGKFNTFLKAVDIAGLKDSLETAGPFTVFAPTDDAFSKLPKGLLDSLLNNKAALKDTLLFHVVPDKFSPTRNGRSYDTLMIGGDTYPKQLTMKVTSWTCEPYVYAGNPNPVKVNQGLMDIKCDNGFIHAIEDVLVPYEGNKIPVWGELTMMGARDIEGTKTLQRGYYGSEAGTGKSFLGTESYEGFPFEKEKFLSAWYEAAWKGF